MISIQYHPGDQEKEADPNTTQGYGDIGCDNAMDLVSRKGLEADSKFGLRAPSGYDRSP
ncbi:hypothetical protein DIPPA_22435 [Diplonema papillatum]|nr:hypothetical protein DIPPA_22435 [Diplonema papillatum]